MTKLQKIVGIDISKSSFDTATKTQGAVKTRKYSYTEEQISKFISTLDSDCLCVMESTGVYHLRLAYKLFQAQIPLAVVNPLSSKRFIQCSMSRSKTDKTDAIWLIQYAEAMKPQLWQPEQEYIIELKQLFNTQANFIKDRTSSTNQLEAITNSVHKSKDAIEILENKIKFIDSQIDNITILLERLIEENNRTEDLENVDSIKGIGRKTATVLIAMVQDISRFESSKKLASYLGMAPSMLQSGTSVRGKSKTCKMGNSYIRMLLYMCARSAKKSNPACRDLYERLLQNGKSKKLALIAVANKLIKQIFAILKSKQKFSLNFNL